MAVAPDRVAELIRSLAEARHHLGAIHDDVDAIESPLAFLYSVELQTYVEALDGVFEGIYRLARPLVELREVEDDEAV